MVADGDSTDVTVLEASEEVAVEEALEETKPEDEAG